VLEQAFGLDLLEKIGPDLTSLSIVERENTYIITMQSSTLRLKWDTQQHSDGVSFVLAISKLALGDREKETLSLSEDGGS
jgi:hypothetical protein